jgi:DNA polymerase III delta prime subunit
MTYTIRPSAEVAFTKAPTISVAGPTGSGKTESAMRLARGYVGPSGKFLVIDTEEKRALYKKARYNFDWMDLQPPFTPANYAGALDTAKGYAAVIVDSGSHEYSGEGGMQDMQLEDLERMSRGDAAKMERLTAPAWKRAKLEHKKLMGQIIRYPTLLIMCLRAEPKIKFVKDQQGKTQIVDAGYQPICEKMFMYEMLVGCLVHADNPGVPQHIKRLEPDLEPVFLPGKQIDESTGERLAAWANARVHAAPQADGTPSSSPKPAGAASPVRTRTQVLEDLCTRAAVTLPSVLERAGVGHSDEMTEQDYADAKAALERRISKASNAARATS